jgi:hypothetical protein
MARKLGRLARFALFLCTAGWAFPHVCTEDMAVTHSEDEHILASSATETEG